MTLTLTPEMEAIVEKLFATGQFATREAVVWVALLALRQRSDRLKAERATEEASVEPHVVPAERD